ncbi:MAG: MBOAT family O-acyltransferase [Alphaproteobacteria bacterium]
MLYNSNAFILAFLPATLCAFFLARHYLSTQAALGLLTVASLVFYGYWDIRFLPLLIGSIAVNYGVARVMSARGNRSFLVAGVVLNLGLLAVFKYLNFFVDSVTDITGIELTIRQIVLPIGISFFTFQQIAFLVDRWRGEADVPSPVNYALFVCFFPQLIAGPIVHHREMVRQFEQLPDSRREIFSRFNIGVGLFAVGLIKKVIIADSLGRFASPLFDRAAQGEQLEAFLAWSAALGYHFQIYFDFSAYSEMAMGLALMFGVRLPANFDSPYRSRDIIDFWRRWHMTLSRFLRDYLYYPLGGNRKGPSRRYANLMIVMLLGGLWHGAAWTFVLWGALHGFYLMVNHAWRKTGRNLPTPWIAVLLTNLAVVIAWVTFRADDLPTALSMYRSMLFMNGTALPLELSAIIQSVGIDAADFSYFSENSRTAFYTGLMWILFAFFVAGFWPNTLQVFGRTPLATDQDRLERDWAARRLSGERRFEFSFPFQFGARNTITAVTIGFLLFVALRELNSAATSEFLYFQF